jgi:hypothetical protein
MPSSLAAGAMWRLLLWNTVSCHVSSHLAYLQALTTFSVTVLAWMCIGSGVYQNTGPSVTGMEAVMFSTFRESSDLGSSMSQMAFVSTATAIVAAGASSGVRTRALAVVIFGTAAVGVPVSARAVWHSLGAATTQCMSASKISLSFKASCFHSRQRGCAAQ